MKLNCIICFASVSCIFQKWRQLFDKFDPEGFGEIPVNDFLVALKSPEFQSQVPFNKIELLYHRALKSNEPQGTGSISFQEFVNVVSSNDISNISMPLRVVDDITCYVTDSQGNE